MNIDNQLITPDSAKRWIEMLQKQLIRENPSALPNDGIDGVYGAETTEWVKRFQLRKGLYVDGIAGTETLKRLRADIVFYVGGPSGRGVEILQEDLLYFYIQQSVVDGIYGASTKQGVKDFQFYNDLYVDGEAGPDTLKKMDELMTKLYVQQGDTGSLVRRIQEQLNKQENENISIAVDGIYGLGTKEAIETYQEANDLTVDGIAGPRTMYLLNPENLVLFNTEENREVFESLGFKYNDSTNEDLEKFSDLFRNHPEVIAAMNGDTFSNIYTTEMNFVNGGNVDNEIVTLVAEVEGKANLAVAGQFFKNSEELTDFSIMDIFGNLPDDDVAVKTYHLDDNGTTVEGVENSNVEMENRLLESQIVFQEAIQQANATGASIAMIGCSDGVVLNNNNIISTQSWEDVVGISCGIAIDISAGLTAFAIATAFGLATGPLAAVTIASIMISNVGAWFFCSWLADQV